MAPKKKPEAAPPPPPADEPDHQPEEEEEEGPGRAAFFLEVGGVTGLPCELETALHFSGPCRPNRSAPATASSAPSSWELKKPRFVRTRNQTLYDDMVDRELIVKLLDAGADDTIIGRASLCLLPLLHENTEVGGELELKLTPEYYKKWFPEPEEEQADPKGKSKAKGKATLTPAADPLPELPVKPSTHVEPPATKIVLKVWVQELVAPVEDRACWTTLCVGVKGVFALPECLTGLGVAGPEEVELHPLKYRGAVLGEVVADGALCRPLRPPPQAEPGSLGPEGLSAEGEEPQAEPKQLSEAEWREQCEQQDFTVKFKGGGHFKRYRGAAFAKMFRRMLNETGGVWFYFHPEEKPVFDSKKGANPPDSAAMATYYKGRAWVDLRALIHRGVNSVDALCPLVALEAGGEAAGLRPSSQSWPPLEKSRAYLRLTLETTRDIVPPEHPSLQVDIDDLLPQRQPHNKFPNSKKAENMYCEAVERAVEVICQDSVTGVKGGVAGVIENMERSGHYIETKEHLRRTIVSVLRERLRKDTNIVPGQPLDLDARGKLLASTHNYLTSTTARILDELRTQHPSDEPMPLAQSLEVERRSEQLLLVPPKPKLGSKDMVRQRMTITASPRSPFGGATPEGYRSPVGSKEKPQSPVTAALSESAVASRTRKVLGVVYDEGERYKRLAFEAEMVGRYDRAAQMLQNRLLLDEFKNEPKEWIAYAKFCARSRGRQAAAEEALQQAVQLLANGAAKSTEETAIEVDLMLACLLLDRGRHDEAIRVFRVWHEKDLADPCCSFLLGLSLYLAGDPRAAAPLLEAVAKPREWFSNLKDDAAVKAKLKKCRRADGPLDPHPYVACLERLLEFGLPSLAFTFIDQCGTLPEEELKREPIALVDAKALALDRDFAECVEHLERFLGTGKASREAWRLAGECYLQLQELDKALQAFNNAMSFENKFDDCVVYVHLGSVLLAKKRWKQASSTFLRSIQFKPTAEAWCGVAYAEYRADELQACYEALCEANVLDSERADVWAQLTLVHLRLENSDSADACFRQCLANSPDCEDLLLEVSTEYIRRERQSSFSEAAARCALRRRNSGQGHSCLADALAAQGQLKPAVQEAKVAIGMMAAFPDPRKSLVERALKWCEELGEPRLPHTVHEAQRRADVEMQKIIPPASP